MTEGSEASYYNTEEKEETKDNASASVKQKEEKSVTKTILKWTVIPLVEGFFQTLVVGVCLHYVIKGINKIRGKKS